MSMNLTTESPLRMMGARGGIVKAENMRSSTGNGALPPTAADGAAQELEMLLRSQSRRNTLLNRKDMLPHRSESAPPTVEGSQASMGGIFPSGVDYVNLSGAGEICDSNIESEQDLRCDPAYLTYYYSHINLNPRLPPPIISRDNYLLAQRLANCSIPDKRRFTSFDDGGNRQSLFSMQASNPTYGEMEACEDQKLQTGCLLRQSSDIRADIGLAVTSEHGLVTRPKSLVDLIQQDFPRTPSPVYSNSRPPSRLANNEESISGSESHLRDKSMVSTAVAELVDAKLLASVTGVANVHLSSSSATPTPLDSLLATNKSAGVHSVENTCMGSSCGHLGPIARVPTPDLSNNSEKLLEEISGLRRGLSSSHLKGISLPVDSSGADPLELAASLQELTLSGKQGGASTEHRGVLPIDHQHESHGQSSFQQAPRHLRRTQSTQSQLPIGQAAMLSMSSQGRPQASALEQNLMAQCKYGINPSSNTPIQAASGSNIYEAAAAAAVSYMAASNPYYSASNGYATPFGVGGYPVNSPLIPVTTPNFSSSMTYENAAAALASGISGRSSATGLSSVDLQQLYKYTSQTGSSLPSRLPDPLYLHYLQNQTVSNQSTNDLPLLRGYGTGTHFDSLDLQKSQLSSMLGYSSETKSQFSRSSSVGLQMGSQCNSVSPAYYGSPPGGFVMPYPTSPLSSSVLPDSPVLPGALSLRHNGRSVGWQGARSSDVSSENLRASSLLDELKNSKLRRFELEDISGHVVEFSVDQHGSRFIQQKLETASIEEKALVFQEVSPHTLILMTDVFGNYVIQKFFEHGSVEQRIELANKLVGHVLDLSLQMYGCRVIQKALEVVSTEQQIQLVSELDGNVMRCVRDQNGNHVIQKCIECVPPEHIQFIISAFRGQVVILSMHPYGCRVIQRVLEHCTDEQKQDGIMDDILHSTCELAQDQYGNYVVQHVLGHGKPHEKSKIMTKLAGQIVQMSQHKFASNVVEKCLEFGGPTERQILITEMLGHTEENEPLQAMMKDQYANYVVQKVLETCDDKQRELLLSRIRIHLHALKKYTYGKHIVARVEKLLAAGERRSAQMAG